MKLRNKKTGEIIDLDIADIKSQFDAISVIPEPAVLGTPVYVYTSLAELNEEWEDYEDELFYVISAEHKDGYICALKDEYQELCDVAKELGIGFETEEEAKKAVEKLKAWKRLKDKGFSFEGYDDGYKHDFNSGHIEFYIENSGDVLEDLGLLFGGEE